MAKNITVFTKNNCPYCALLKRFLDMKGVTYETINMDESPDHLNEVMNMTGRAIGPTTMVQKEDGTKDLIVGYNLSRIVSAIS